MTSARATTIDLAHLPVLVLGKRTRSSHSCSRCRRHSLKHGPPFWGAVLALLSDFVLVHVVKESHTLSKHVSIYIILFNRPILRSL